MDCAVWSFTRMTVCPTNTISSSGNSTPCRFTDCEFVCALNFSPLSLFPCTVRGTVKATRSVRLRSLHRKCSKDISTGTSNLFSTTAGLGLLLSDGPRHAISRQQDAEAKERQNRGD